MPDYSRYGSLGPAVGSGVSKGVLAMIKAIMAKRKAEEEKGYRQDILGLRRKEVDLGREKLAQSASQSDREFKLRGGERERGRIEAAGAGMRKQEEAEAGRTYETESREDKQAHDIVLAKLRHGEPKAVVDPDQKIIQDYISWGMKKIYGGLSPSQITDILRNKPDTYTGTDAEYVANMRKSAGVDPDQFMESIARLERILGGRSGKEGLSIQVPTPEEYEQISPQEKAKWEKYLFSE